MSLRILLILLLPGSALACDFCMLGQGISPYLTDNGRGLTIETLYSESSQVYDHQSETQSHGKKESWLIYSLTGFYSFTDSFSGSITLPYAMKSNIDFEEDTQTNPGALVTGVGDVLLSGRYSLAKSHSLDSTFIAGAILGLKLPTGSTNNQLPSGGPVDRHALPGTGSLDVNLGGSLAYTMASGCQITGDLIYDHAGAGRWNGWTHQYGNSINFSLKGFYRISPAELGADVDLSRSFFLFTGPSGEWMGKEKGTLTDTGYVSSLTNDSSGGTVLFWDVGLYAGLSPQTLLNLSFGKAIYHNMNFSAAFDADPAEDYKLSSGITLLF